MFRTSCFAMLASVAAVTLGSNTSHAQQPPPQSPNMTFFVTSTGPGKGADLIRTQETLFVGREVEKTLLQGLFDRCARDSTVELVQIS